MANTPLAHLPKCTLFAPREFCISIVFNFPLGGCDTQERKKKWVGVGGGQIRCIMGDVQVVYS